MNIKIHRHTAKVFAHISLQRSTSLFFYLFRALHSSLLLTKTSTETNALSVSGGSHISRKRNRKTESLKRMECQMLYSSTFKHQTPYPGARHLCLEWNRFSITKAHDISLVPSPNIIADFGTETIQKKTIRRMPNWNRNKYWRKTSENGNGFWFAKKERKTKRKLNTETQCKNGENEEEKTNTKTRSPRGNETHAKVFLRATNTRIQIFGTKNFPLGK